jgi:hypothetical protein
MYRRLMVARKLAAENNSIATEKTKMYFDTSQKAQQHSFVNNQMVLLEEYNFLGRNTKLCPKWSGPHRIINLKGTHCVELLLLNNRKTIVNVDRIKPYFVNGNDSSQGSTDPQNDASLDGAVSLHTNDVTLSETTQLTETDEETTLRTQTSRHDPAIDLSRSSSASSALPKKRGRPPKTRAHFSSPPPPTALPANLPAPPTLFQNNGGIVTRSQARTYAFQNKQVSGILKDKITKKKLSENKNDRLRKTRFIKRSQTAQLCDCHINNNNNNNSNTHTIKCQQKFKQIWDLFKEQNSWSDHSVFYEPAEFVEEEDDPFVDPGSPDPGYGGSSPVPPNIFDDEEIQENDSIKSTNEEAEQLPTTPESSPDRRPPIHADPSSSRAVRIPVQPHRHSTTENSSEFHSVNESLADLEKTLEQLNADTAHALSLSTSREEYEEILDQHREGAQTLRNAFKQLQPPPGASSGQPGTSTPKKSPFSGLEEFLFGDTTPVRRHTRRHGDVEDLPLPRRPPEYKPVKKK